MGTRKAELDKKLEKGSEAAHTAMLNRGRIIGLASDIENELTNIITWCFYPAKYSTKLVSNDLLNENGIIFKSIILNKIDFHDKINMLKEVILAKKPNIWKNHSRLIKDIIFGLDKVRVFRNLMAHASSDLSDVYLKSVEINTDKIKKEFQILEYNKGRLIKHRIDEKTMEYYMWKSAMTSLELSQLFALINEDQKSYKEYEEPIYKIKELVSALSNYKRI